MNCREGCGACCIAPSISSPIPGMPHGKPAGAVQEGPAVDVAMHVGVKQDQQFLVKIGGGQEREGAGRILGEDGARFSQWACGWHGHPPQSARPVEDLEDTREVQVTVAGHETDGAIINILRWYEALGALVFCATREGVKTLHQRLLDKGFTAVALSGELTQAERTAALSATQRSAASSSRPRTQSSYSARPFGCRSQKPSVATSRWSARGSPSIPAGSTSSRAAAWRP